MAMRDYKKYLEVLKIDDPKRRFDEYMLLAMDDYESLTDEEKAASHQAYVEAVGPDGKGFIRQSIAQLEQMLERKDLSGKDRKDIQAELKAQILYLTEGK